MTKGEFLRKLKEALANDLDNRAVEENCAYYSSYIDDEIRKGRSEAEVLEELGDPWVIAQSVIGMSERRLGGDGESGKDGTSGRQQGGAYGAGYEMQSRGFVLDSWWKWLLVVLGILGLCFLVFAVVGGLLSLVAPILLPVMLVIFIVRLVTRRR